MPDGFTEIFGNMRAADVPFDSWYNALCASTPSMRVGIIKLTPDNFRKALRQAYRAGAATGKDE